MNKIELQENLTATHTTFCEEIQHLSDVDFMYAPTGKWSAGQQLAHIVKSVSPVNLAFSLPAFLIKMVFGKANRPSRTYDALVEKYKLKLAEGGRASARFIPPQVNISDREVLLAKVQRLINSLNKRISAASEQELDLLILPHPLLGKLTFREMLYFTTYHVEHHHKHVMSNLNSKNSLV